MLVDHFPPLGLLLRTPRLELRIPTGEALADLADLAVDGIHPPETMPFVFPWTDQPPAELARDVLRHHWRHLANWTPRNWSLLLAVVRDGTVVGQQALSGREFAITREVTTGSWLGQRYQGQGIGTEMRAAVLHLAFAGLGAEAAISGAFTDNPASLAVSRKLGYQPDGISRHAVRGELVIEQRMRLSRQDWERHRRIDVTIEGLEPCLSLFGLDAG